MSAEFSSEQKTERGSKYIFVKLNAVMYIGLYNVLVFFTIVLVIIYC